MGFFSFLSNTAETRELHSEVQLRSRYYKTNYAKAKAVVIEYAEKNKMVVRNVDDDHRELFLQGDRFHIIVVFVQVTPIETSVDFKVETYGLAGWGKPKKRIVALYQYLDQNLAFKGIGLHP